MTTQPAGRIPQWTLADRLRKAREDAGFDQNRLAALMGTARNTVGNYEHGNTAPRPYILKEWALVTGVPLWWLKGEAGPGKSQEPTDSLAVVIPFPRAHRGQEASGEPLPVAL